jgi:hypothetical protein
MSDKLNAQLIDAIRFIHLELENDRGEELQLEELHALNADKILDTFCRDYSGDLCLLLTKELVKRL